MESALSGYKIPDTTSILKRVPLWGLEHHPETPWGINPNLLWCFTNSLKYTEVIFLGFCFGGHTFLGFSQKWNCFHVRPLQLGREHTQLHPILMNWDSSGIFSSWTVNVSPAYARFFIFSLCASNSLHAGQNPCLFVTSLLDQTSFDKYQNDLNIQTE